ncbi:eukaryotic translation initiation factor 3 subunit C [Columba livia]|uniref:Eukaryotic translation initiation factor 3 subunit C n=1 Tax=Columba livia TaxID=8932 RepID=A0A2I0LH65_COLLI|nr:eukaryotic translation initiation factor 3 subunit C [Columba livia]
MSSLQILYNRTMVQLGICAFREGLIKDAHNALLDIQSSGRAKELLGQGLLLRSLQERNPEQEKVEKRRQVPFHMHVNLELLECVYLVAAMLLEIPYMAAHEFDARRRMISKQFHHQLRVGERQPLLGEGKGPKNASIRPKNRLVFLREIPVLFCTKFPSFSRQNRMVFPPKCPVYSRQYVPFFPAKISLFFPAKMSQFFPPKYPVFTSQKSRVFPAKMSRFFPAKISRLFLTKYHDFPAKISHFFPAKMSPFFTPKCPVFSWQNIMVFPPKYPGFFPPKYPGFSPPKSQVFLAKISRFFLTKILGISRQNILRQTPISLPEASLDQPTSTVMMHRTEPTNQQNLALQLAEKLGNLVENNERVFDHKQGTYGGYFRDQKDGYRKGDGGYLRRGGYRQQERGSNY